MQDHNAELIKGAKAMKIDEETHKEIIEKRLDALEKKPA